MAVSNSTLITSADVVSVGGIDANNVYASTDKATAFVIDSFAQTGDDTITGFGKNDSILTTRKLFDSNNDKIINFGDGFLDIDRSSESNAGRDQLKVLGLESQALRYLGEKDGNFVYADASVKLAGFTEGTVNNDTLSGLGGAKTFFFDNALGLNFGLDKINGFGADDELVFTAKILDDNTNGIVNFGENKLLDVSGEGGALPTDPIRHPGGQIDVNGLNGDVTALQFDRAELVNGVSYYHYSLPDIIAI